MSAMIKKFRWVASATVAPDTDWFSSDVVGRGSGTLSGSFSSTHTILIVVPTATVVNLQVVKDGQTKTVDINQGSPLAANQGFEFDFEVHGNMSYNIQHKTGTQNVAVLISEEVGHE